MTPITPTPTRQMALGTGLEVLEALSTDQPWTVYWKSSMGPTGKFVQPLLFILIIRQSRVHESKQTEEPKDII